MNEIKKEIQVLKGESSLDAIQKAIPHWIHDTRKDDSSVTGEVFLPSCKCSLCGYHSNMEKERCPHCGAIMRKIKGVY
jgi:rubrerythrin